MKATIGSICLTAIRAFMGTLFGVLGLALASLLIILACYGLFSVAEEETYSSKVKLLPDAEGNRKKLSAGAPVLLQLNIQGEIGKDKLTGEEIDQRFVEIVSTERPIDKEKLIHTVGAKVFPAPAALELGIIDQCCTSRAQALEGLAQAAHIEGKYQVVEFETKSWWKKWLKEEGPSSLLSGKIKHALSLPKSSSNPFSYIFVR